MLVLVFLFILIGVPALGLAFGKINGRPVYATLPVIMKYLTGAKSLVFHKEMIKLSSREVKLKNAEVGNEKQSDEPEEQGATDPQARLLKINRLLEEQAARASKLTKQLHNS